MGVHVDMFVAPADGRRLSFEQFTHLIMSLVQERIVKLPFAIVEGDLTSKDEDGQADCFHPYGIILTPLHNPDTEQTKWQRCTGESLQELQAALQDLPFGKTDLAVWFDALDWGNDELREALTRQGSANAEVVVYALQRPSEVVLGSAYVAGGNEHSYNLMHYFTTAGKSGPHDIEDTMLESVLADFFGPAMIVDCSWG